MKNLSNPFNSSDLIWFLKLASKVTACIMVASAVLLILDWIFPKLALTFYVLTTALGVIPEWAWVTVASGGLIALFLLSADRYMKQVIDERIKNALNDFRK